MAFIVRVAYIKSLSKNPDSAPEDPKPETLKSIESSRVKISGLRFRV